MSENPTGAVKAIRDFVRERQHQDKASVLRFRTDGGGEYVNQDLREFFTQNGIVHEITPAYSYESNGIAERFNRTIVTMARSMLTGLPMAVWSEAIATAVYLKNRVPHKAVKESTPYEALHGNKPTIQHLQPFGRKCYVHIPEEKRPDGSKLLPRALEGKFIGYTESNKIFRIYIPSQHKVVQTRQVRFTRLDSGEVELPLQTPHVPTFTSIELPVPIHQRQRIVEEEREPEEQHPEIAQPEIEIQPPEAPPNPEEYERFEPEPTPPPEPQPRRSGRHNIGEQPQRYGFSRQVTDEIFELIDDEEPRTYGQAITGPLSPRWKKAMEEEMDALRRNNTFDLVPRPKGRKITGCKGVYKIKRLADGSIERFKDRGVAKGYSQVQGQDFDDIFAPVVRYESLR